MRLIQKEIIRTSSTVQIMFEQVNGSPTAILLEKMARGEFEPRYIRSGACGPFGHSFLDPQAIENMKPEHQAIAHEMVNESYNAIQFLEGFNPDWWQGGATESKLTTNNEHPTKGTHNETHLNKNNSRP